MAWHVFSWFCVLSLRVAIRYSGGYCAGVLPLPIPNREVKPGCADGTAMQCGRVGGRLLLRSEGRVSSEEEIRSSFFCAYMMLLMAACCAIVCSFLFSFYLQIYCYMV